MLQPRPYNPCRHSPISQCYTCSWSSSGPTLVTHTLIERVIPNDGIFLIVSEPDTHTRGRPVVARLGVDHITSQRFLNRASTIPCEYTVVDVFSHRSINVQGIFPCSGSFHETCSGEMASTQKSTTFLHIPSINYSSTTCRYLSISAPEDIYHYLLTHDL